ncbi:hypothetical protein B0H15DRAFT_806628 [Mycena belliarum]|uniref:Uncharacterized protein n=1 Tax=Mycena belliarum TaxID=1033014 RepID=A0AAD6TQ35_9AGAR|nr:hypothetical protein B0H15DRAFT_806628 [Mycena belliae]
MFHRTLLLLSLSALSVGALASIPLYGQCGGDDIVWTDMSPGGGGEHLDWRGREEHQHHRRRGGGSALRQVLGHVVKSADCRTSAWITNVRRMVCKFVRSPDQAELGNIPASIEVLRQMNEPAKEPAYSRVYLAESPGLPNHGAFRPT